MAAIRPVPRKVQVRIPAKINISLKVGPPRADGYHELATIFHAVSLYDVVTVAESTDGMSLHCEIGRAHV